MNRLAGVTFSVYTDDACRNLLTTIVTDEHGVGISEAISIDGSGKRILFVKETALTDEQKPLYELSHTVYPVVVFPNQTVQVNNGKTIINRWTLGQITLTKINENGTPLNEVTFDVLFERLKYRDPNHLAVKYYKSYRSGSGKTLKSIQITLIARLEKFNLSSLEAITQSDDLELWSVGEKKTAIFAVIPDNDSSFNFLVGMLYTQLFQQLYNQADFVHGGRLPVHVHFLMDEFANVALPDDFDKLLATMRSREISVSIIIQNLAQLKALFEKQWESIVGNCDEFLYLGGNEKETHKYISELLGKETIDLNTYGQSHGRNGNYSTNWQLSGRELMTPDEVRLLDNRFAILFIRGERPIIDEKFDILRHPNVALSADGGTKPYIHGFANCAGVSIIPETDTDESKDKVPEFELPDGIELLDLELLSEEEILQEINDNERNESNNEKHD